MYFTFNGTSSERYGLKVSESKEPILNFNNKIKELEQQIVRIIES